MLKVRIRFAEQEVCIFANSHLLKVIQEISHHLYMTYMINPKASGLSLHIMLEFRTMSSGSKINNSGVINTGER